MVSDHRRIVQRILRVSHAGEQGAISIYGAQIARAATRGDSARLVVGLRSEQAA
jgi:demethoxyubiquinone hydroxylase (CLK1/Coq7/Cat5 family)